MRSLPATLGLVVIAGGCSLPGPTEVGDDTQQPIAAAAVPAVCEGKTFVGEIIDGRGDGNMLTAAGRRFVRVQTEGGWARFYATAIARGYAGSSFDLPRENWLATMYYEANNECAVDIALSLRRDQTNQGTANIFTRRETINESNLGTWTYSLNRDPNNNWVRVRWSIRNAQARVGADAKLEASVVAGKEEPPLDDGDDGCGITSAGAPPTGPDGESCDENDECCEPAEGEASSEGPTCL